MRPTTQTTRPGFTLIEMLMVIAITAVIMALSFPMIAAMRRDSSTSSGINTISLAVSATRRYATDPNLKFVQADIDSTPGTGSSEPGVFSGVAAVFTPAGEIRLTKNKENARSTAGWYLERRGPRLGDVQPPGLPARELNGFEDIPGLDYVRLGSDVGVAGITRNTRYSGANKPPLLLPPPFAVWFDQNGYLVSTGQDLSVPGKPELDYQFVYYDGNYDGRYYCNIGRWPINYDPNVYNPNHGDFNTANYDKTAEKYRLAFERLESVIGVYIYSQAEFEGAVDDGVIPPWEDMDEADNESRWAWMQANGEMMLFSRQTGMVMRNRDE